MTIEAVGDARALEQNRKQLHKLVDVFKVVNLSEQEHIEREIVLAKKQNSGSSQR